MFDVRTFAQAEISPDGNTVACVESWHALKTMGVPTQFVTYPHEGHEFADPAHSRDVIERAVGWFNQYLQLSR
jgi:Prolyl oligopeptidase family